MSRLIPLHAQAATGCGPQTAFRNSQPKALGTSQASNASISTVSTELPGVENRLARSQPAAPRRCVGAPLIQRSVRRTRALYQFMNSEMARLIAR